MGYDTCSFKLLLSPRRSEKVLVEQCFSLPEDLCWILCDCILQLGSRGKAFLYLTSPVEVRGASGLLESDWLRVPSGPSLVYTSSKANYMSLTFLRIIYIFFFNSGKGRGRCFLRLPEEVSFNIWQAALLSWESDGVMVGSALSMYWLKNTVNKAWCTKVARISKL